MSPFAKAIRCLFVVIAGFVSLPDGQSFLGNVSAQENSESASVESPASTALKRSTWYNPDERALVPVTVKDKTDDSVHRDSRWLPKPKKLKRAAPVAAAPAAANAPAGNNGVLGTDLTFANLFGWMLLALLLIALVGALVYTLSKAEIDLDGGGQKAIVKTNEQQVDRQTIERMKHLPAELRRTDVNLRTEAQRLMNGGEFDQAIILLFGHQLLMLDRAGFLRLTRGKTNGRYVRETRSINAECGTRLRTTATAFEKSYFGRHTLTAAEFDELWKNNEALEQHIQSSEVAA